MKGPVGLLDPYGASRAVEKLRRSYQRGLPLRLACMDIDSTLTSDHEKANRVRRVLEERGFVVGFNTSRTEEMVMSAATYVATQSDTSFGRPPPQLGRRHGAQPPCIKDRARWVVAPETVEAAGVLDGDFIVGSSGTRLLWRQTDGQYLVDRDYEGRYGVDTVRWREQTLTTVRALFASGVPGTLADIEDPENYRIGRSDVYPPQFRVQIDFRTLMDKLRLENGLRMVGHGRSPYAENARRLSVTDDSDPRNNHWKVFVTPRGGTKAHAAEWLIGRLCGSAGIGRQHLEVLFAGDSFPDLDMGLMGGLGTVATFLIVGDSRLVEALTSARTHVFAGRSLTAYRRRMRPFSTRGMYTFLVPCRFGGSRTILIGDVLFPDTHAVETVYCYVSM